VFNSLGWPELAILAILGLFVFGPEKLPKVIADTARILKTLRAQANSITSDLKAELGPELGDVDLRSLDPRHLVQSHLNGDDEPARSNGSRSGGTAGPAPRAAPAAALRTGERPPYDPDAT
jgi:sec-independent protein translocase protein TatB